MTQIEHTKLLLEKHARGQKCPGVGLHCGECPAHGNGDPAAHCHNTAWFRDWLAKNDTQEKPVTASTEEPRMHNASDCAPSHTCVWATITLPSDYRIKPSLCRESDEERDARLLATIKTKN